MSDEMDKHLSGCKISGASYGHSREEEPTVVTIQAEISFDVSYKDYERLFKGLIDDEIKFKRLCSLIKKMSI